MCLPCIFLCFNVTWCDVSSGNPSSSAPHLKQETMDYLSSAAPPDGAFNVKSEPRTPSLDPAALSFVSPSFFNKFLNHKVCQLRSHPGLFSIYRISRKDRRAFSPQILISNLGMRQTFQVQTATSHQPFHPGLCVSLSRGRLLPVINHSTLAYVCHYPGADCHQSSTIPPWPMCVTIQVQTATSHQPFHPGLCVSLSRCRLPPVINHSTLAYVCHYPGADCHQSSTIHPGLCVSLSRCRLPPVIKHSILVYVCHYPGADCHQSSNIPSWPMCVTIQGQTATSHQPFHPDLCVSLSRCRLPPVINHSTLTYVCYYPGADCHQSSTIPPWPMCVTIQGQTATSHQPFHPGLCVSLSRCRLPPVINHSTLAYVCHYPGADCHQSSTIPPWPMCVTIQGQTATSHQPFHPGLCVSLSRCRLPPVIKHSILVYVCHYPGADCHQSSNIPSWPMCVTIQGQTATSHQPFHPDLCVSLSRCRLPPVINHSTLTYVCYYPGADCHQSSTIPPWPMCVTIQGPPWLSDFISQQVGQNTESIDNILLVDIIG